jgi:hypothetical protein
MTATVPATTPKPRRRWLQFSLRTMLVLVLICSLPCGWLAYEVGKAREQAAAAKAIEELGGLVEFGPASGGLPRRVVAWLGTLAGEDWAEDVIGAFLFGTEVSDDPLEQLNGLSHLRYLNLFDTQVTDAGLEHLRRLTQLQLLWLDDTQVTDAGLEHLRGLTQLKSLSIFHTQVTDAGVAGLQKALANCKITR